MTGPVPPALEEALKRRQARRSEYHGLPYVHYVADTPEVVRGTAILGGRVVFGYPHIGRVLALLQGLSEQFSAPFWAEEKIDGYNVRITRVDGQAVALTRGGYICPFTTDRLGDLLDLSVFDAEPDLVICAEIAGPGNPYQESAPPFIEHDVQLFTFDLMRLDRPSFLPHHEKTRLLERLRLPAVQCFGRFTVNQVPAIQEVLRQLNAEGREGLVFKEDSETNHRAKYVTSNSSIADIRSTTSNFLDLPAEYFTNRILRLVIFLREQGLGHSAELDQRLGAAFLDGLLEGMQRYEREQRVYYTYRCRLRTREAAEALLTHLKRAGGHKVQVVQRELRQEGGYWVLAFDRIYPGMSGLLGHLLQGGLVFD